MTENKETASLALSDPSASLNLSISIAVYWQKWNCSFLMTAVTC